MEEAYLRWARQARASIREVRRMLLRPTPETLDLCQPYLAESIARLKDLETAIRSGRAPQVASLRAEVRALRKDLAQVNAMLQHAASFHLGWVGLLASMTEGYTPRGEPARREPIRRISMEG